MADESDRYSIYVIELPSEAASDRKMRKQNPHADPTRECLYVGYTHKPIVERFDDHRLKRKTAADITRKFGVVRLRPDLAAGKYAMGAEKAKVIEERLAASLRAKGHAVRQA